MANYVNKFVVKRFFLCLFLLFFIVNCAGTAGQSSLLGFGSSENAKMSVSNFDGVLIAIRYPAKFSTTAKNAFIRDFVSSPIGGDIEAYQADEESPVSPELVAKDVITKSSYYTVLLYTDLSNRLPKAKVVLEPMTIGYSSGKYTAKTMSGVAPIPAALNVESFVYSHPAREAMMDSPPLTFGDLVSPVIYAWTGSQISPETAGNIIFPKQLDDTPIKYVNSNTGLDDRHSFRFLDYLNRKEGADVLTFGDIAKKGSRRPRKAGPAVAYSIPKLKNKQIYYIEVPNETVEVAEGAETPMKDRAVYEINSRDELDTHAKSLFGSISNMLISYLNILDLELASMDMRRDYIRSYDRFIVDFYPYKGDDERVLKRLDALRAIERQERESYRTVVDQKFVEKTILGKVGQNVRKLIAEEADVLNARRKLNRTANTQSIAGLGLGLFSGALIGAYGSQATSTANQLTDFASLLITTADAERITSKAVGKNWGSKFASLYQTISAQAEYSVSDTRRVSNVRFFRSALKNRYTAVRSRNNVPSRGTCKLAHPTHEKAKVIWYGGCKNGYAIGHGHAIWYDGKNLLSEYLGPVSQGAVGSVGEKVTLINHSDAPSTLGRPIERFPNVRKIKLQGE